jgi:hypothetical protein
VPKWRATPSLQRSTSWTPAPQASPRPGTLRPALTAPPPSPTAAGNSQQPRTASPIGEDARQELTLRPVPSGDLLTDLPVQFPEVLLHLPEIKEQVLGQSGQLLEVVQGFRGSHHLMLPSRMRCISAVRS